MISKVLDEIISKILDKANPLKIILFGSQTRDDKQLNSDIDIAIEGLDKEVCLKLKDYLNEEVATLRDIDVICLDSLNNEDLKKKIYSEGKIIYERSIK